VFQKKVLLRLFGLEEEEVKEEQEKYTNDELYSLYPSPGIYKYT
jgi:hypothetical protein